ncbi:MAG: hypothetical protein Q7O66_16605 [Dehalococcoidia bacterium]|nr:hypothetical protein [Dehalococcoidia bacterium]
MEPKPIYNCPNTEPKPIPCTMAIRNCLTVIKGRMQLAERRLTASDATDIGYIEYQLDIIGQQVEIMVGIVEEMEREG